ncbi:hypothetical protein APHAL10511_003577 [Amanita phalloides]|nr:hypothetical protein APHAL10511_003577 [Amanita phalloides]
MSEVQSNAGHHLYQNPFDPSRDIVLPPYMIYGMECRTFWCAVYGSSIVFQISAHPDADVDDLKGKIKEKKGALRDHNASKLVLWKLSVPEPVDPEDSFWQRIRKRGDLATFAEKISRHKVSEVFPQLRLLEDYVHILVELPSNNSRSWLAVIHRTLWGEREFFGKIFHTANLTEHHFKELQDLLDKENPGRTSDLYVAKNVLAKKSDFLCEKSKPLEIDFGDGLVPRLVFDATQPPSSGPADNDDVADDNNDAVADGNDDAVADDDDNALADDNDDTMDIDPNHGYAGSHTDHLSMEAKAIFPYTIQYVDLTVLNLKNNFRVPPLMLFRNEWGTMIDIFNKRTHLNGIKGSTIFTGQPGIGKTCLLYSILILCMIRAQQFVFQDMNGKIFIIDDAGISTPEDAWEAVSDDEVLTLVDADAKCYEPESYLVDDFRHRILLTSSPRSRRDRSWLKQFARQNAVFTMKPWSREEFVVATRVYFTRLVPLLTINRLFLRETDITLKRLQEASLICGNIARPCFEAAASLTDLRAA